MNQPGSSGLDKAGPSGLNKAGSSGLPAGLLLAFYGDDFTGSTDTMEVMAFAGLPTVVFLKPPSAQALARFSDRRGIGIAGTARSKSPEWMDENLPAVFRTLFSLNAPITQYKVCSTFDSSATTGSIGRAIDLAMPMASEQWSPLVVAAPQLRRWQCFGNLFAGVGTVRYRLDRHPTMSRHPMTPMAEADLTRHLAAQTRRPISLVDLNDLGGTRGEAVLRSAIGQHRIVAFDVADEASQVEVGRLVWENRGKGLFSASSSGLQYALVAYWRARGLLLPPSPGMAPASGPIERLAPVSAAPIPAVPLAVDRLLVVSGSCSPATASQIEGAIAAGFEPIRLDAARSADPNTRASEVLPAIAAASRALRAGRDALLFTAQSPDDPAIGQLSAYCQAAGIRTVDAQEALGDALGEITSSLMRQNPLRRLVLAGGDTSGRIVSRLPIDALEAVAPLAPGAPICRCYSSDERFDGMELVMKGGQVGDQDFFVSAKAGISRGELR